MIYWFIGQPGCGKTTLAKLLKSHLDSWNIPSIHLDGDDLRRIFGGTYKSEHFTREYRNTNTRKLQLFVEHIEKQGVNVIVSTVNAERCIREDLKNRNPHVLEIYVYNTGLHPREENNYSDFEPPTEEYISIDTNGLTPVDAFTKIMSDKRMCTYDY